MDTNKLILVVGLGAAAYFGYKAFVGLSTRSPAPVPAQQPTANMQGGGATRPTSLDQFTQYGTAIGSGVGAVTDIYNKVFGGG